MAVRKFSILKKLQEMLVSVGLVVVENSRAIVPHRSNTSTKIRNMALSPHFHYYLIWRRIMNYSKLFEVGKPPFFTLVIDTASLDSLYLQLFDKHKGAVIRMVRGSKSKTTPDFFNEVAAALQFPYYFGENWDAFNDCIKDFHWLQADSYLLIVRDANLLLCDGDSDSFRILIQILSEANEEWITPNLHEYKKSPIPFHVLFHCNEVYFEAFYQRLIDTEAVFQPLLSVELSC